MSRILPDWLEAFQEYTDQLTSPLEFRLWGGIALIAATLERKVWIETDLGILYPNIYSLMVAPPGVGKTLITSLTWRMAQSLTGHKVSSSSITRATMIEELAGADRYYTKPGGGTVHYNSLFICINELGVLLPGYELEMMNKLTDIYDGHPYSEKRRNEKHNADIKHPQFNLFAAVTPGYLSSILPEVAWEQGFLSRTILVYSDEVIRKSLFKKTQRSKELWNHLIADLKQIDLMKGEYTFTPEAAELVDDFYIRGHEKTAPRHPKLQHYNTRRPAHLLKLIQIAHASRSDSLIIEEEDVDRALGWLIGAESKVPEIFKSMGSGGDAQIMKDAWYFVYERVLSSGKPVSRDHLITFLSQRVPAEKVKWVLSVMEERKLLLIEQTSAGPMYKAAQGPN